MGVTNINKLIIPIFLLILLSSSVLGAVAVDDTSGLMQSLNERLERNKAEIIKAINDGNTKNQNATAKSIDENFGVLDGRMEGFFKASKREIAIIMVGGFLIAFTLSQIIRLKIEQMRRKSLIRRAMELDVAVEKLTKEATDLTTKVKELKALDETYSKQLKSLTKKQPFITIQAILLAIIAFCIGLVIPLLLKVNLSG